MTRYIYCMTNEIKKFTVEDLKTRLDKFLAEQISDLSRSKIQRAIELGLVTVNGEVITLSKHVPCARMTKLVTSCAGRSY
jgi:RNA-binding protein YlmH